MNNSINNNWYPGKITTPYDKLYVPEIFGRVSLPHRDPGTLTYLAWDKDYAFSIASGYNYIEDEKILKKRGIPFGIYPRLILILITTHAIHTKSRKIVLSKDLSEFIESMGYTVTGGKNGSITQLNAQVKRLLNCRICIRWSTKNRKTQKYLHPVDRIDIWESQKNESSNSEEKVYAVISESYYQWIQETAFPVKPATVEALRRSLLALDLYFFLTSRCFRLKHKDVAISWASLEKQLGVNYKHTSEFARQAKKAINYIQNWYPKLKVKYKRGRLIILASSKPQIE